MFVKTIWSHVRRLMADATSSTAAFEPGQPRHPLAQIAWPPWQATRRRLACSGSAWSNALLDLIFPPICVDCRSGLGETSEPLPLCASCQAELGRGLTAAACLGCGLPRPAGLPSSVQCLECLRQKFRFHRAVALGPYQGHLRQVTIRMKRFEEYPLTDAVGCLLAQRLKHQLVGDLPQVIVPIPKFWVKRVLRGTNTSDVLARALGRQLGRPTNIGALRLRRSTRKQSLLSRHERHQNVTRALKLAQGYNFDKADVLIVDDIMTTGATASEAARVLARAGARRITVAVAARALYGRHDFAAQNAGQMRSIDALGVSTSKLNSKHASERN